MTEPVAGSGSWPSWIARVSKSMYPILVTEVGPPDRRHAARIVDLLRAEPFREAPHGTSDSRACPLRCARLGEDALHAQHLALAVEDRLDAPDDAIAPEDGQDVVAVLALRLGHVH